MSGYKPVGEAGDISLDVLDQELDNELDDVDNELEYNDKHSPESWNNPKRNILKLAAAFYGFIIVGMNDSGLGVLVPYLEKDMELSHLSVSMAFLAPAIGFCTSAVFNDRVHRVLGRWGVSMLGTSLALTCYLIASLKPPFFILVLCYGLAGLGSGFLDACWISWCGALNHHNEVSGILQGCYGLGGILCPAVFAKLLTSGYSWNVCYYFMSSVSVVSVAMSTMAFRDETAEKYLRAVAHDDPDQTDSGFMQCVKTPLVWLCAITLIFYVGGEVSLGGWISTFMIEIRHGDMDKMSYVTLGFWAGVTVGRVVLGFITGHYRREELFTAIYMMGSVVSLVMFWIVPNLVGSAIFVAVVGVFMGPIYPTVTIVALKKLPVHLHITGLGFATSLAGAGSAVLPFLTGILANQHGAQVLGPTVLVFYVIMTAFWLVVLKWF